MNLEFSVPFYEWLIKVKQEDLFSPSHDNWHVSGGCNIECNIYLMSISIGKFCTFRVFRKNSASVSHICIAVGASGCKYSHLLWSVGDNLTWKRRWYQPSVLSRGDLIDSLRRSRMIRPSWCPVPRGVGLNVTADWIL